MAGFYQSINDEFGPEVRATLKEYADNNRRMSNMVVRKDFLIRCRKEGLFPSHIQNSFKCVFQLLEERSPYLRNLESCITTFKRKVLSLEIRHTYFRIKQLRAMEQQLRAKLSGELPESRYTTFFASQEIFFERQTTSNRQKTSNKFERLLATMIDHCSSRSPSLNEKAIHNATEITLPEKVELLLSLGPKFALPSTNVAEMPFYHLLADVESVIQTHQDADVQERTRCRVANNIQNFIHRQQHAGPMHPNERFLKEAERETRSFLKQHPNLYVLKADKGNKTVIMHKQDYVARMDQLLADTNTYEKTQRDPTSAFQTKNNGIVRRLENLGLLDAATARRLRTYKAVCPRIYGQPKTHKPGLPLRPVVPCMTSPSYELSKFVGAIIQRSLHSKYNISDSFKFCELVNTVTLPEGHVMVSFDVVSLFTCIPQTLVRKSIIKHWDEIGTHTDICLDLFLEVTAFCIECSYFSFNGSFYKQKFGTAMGNPLSPMIADLVMEDILDQAVEAVPFPIPYLKKYVDDLFLALPGDKIEMVQEIFNSQDENLQFTVEREQNNRLPFLDMVMTRNQNQTITTEWYMKPISSGRFLNYRSLHSFNQKMNVAFNFAKRVYTFTTNHREEEVESVIRRQLLVNDYPNTLISRVINRVKLHRQQVDTAMEANENRPDEGETVFRSLTNIDGLSQQIIKTLRREYPTRIATKTTNTVGAILPQIKDKTPNDEQSNIIYKINCDNCDGCYIGMTTTKLKTRISGHRSNVRRLTTLREAGHTNADAAIISIREKTALVDHAAENDHVFRLDDVKILDRTQKPSNLPILESCHIYNTPHTVNKRTDTDNLNVVYAGLLHSIMNVKRTKSNNQNRPNVNMTQTDDTDTTETEHTTHE
ncbi:uncharacterized protein LOC134285243 [Aedes albopictus]|uniref:Helix-turn-helix domain-containing protein n=2 Tax=Aedes albopictus TaxID=7160 RepID=A0ABM1Z4Q6_AEDAL